MKRHLMWMFLCSLIFALTGGLAFGEDETEGGDYRVYTLGEVVISEKGTTVKEIAVNNVVTQEEIMATNSKSAAEALAYVPGVEVSTGRKNEAGISIHGFPQDRTLVLIDGVPYYETSAGKLDLNQIPADIIARIEVIKGAPSVLYGPNAEIGVINIITKKAGEKPSVTARVEAAEKDAYLASLSHGMKVGKFSYWLNYTHREWEAWRLSDNFDPVLGAIVRRPGGTTPAFLEDGGNFRDNSDYENDSIWAKVGYEASRDSEYYANMHYSNTEKGVPPSINEETVFPDRPAFSGFVRFPKYQDWGIDLSGRQKIAEPLTLQGTLFYHYHADEYASYLDPTFSDRIALSRYQDYLIGGMLLAEFRPVEWNALRTAFHYKGDSHEERDDSYLPYAESFSYTGSVAVEDDLRISENFSVVAGVSYDWFSVDEAELNVTDRDTGDFVEQVELDTPSTKDEFNPMIGATYTFHDSTRLFASVARKTRFPTLGQLFSTRSGNINLEAERSVNYTVGATRVFKNMLRLELAPFYHDISNWISRDAPGAEGTYQNYADIEMYGFEFIGEFYPVENFLLKWGYMYNHATDESSGRVTDKVRLVPKHKVDVGAAYVIPGLKTRLDLNMIFLGSSYDQLPTPERPDDPEVKRDAYTLFTAKVSQPFMNMFEAYLAVHNLFDKDYESEVGFPGVGRTVWVGLKVSYP